MLYFTNNASGGGIGNQMQQIIGIIAMAKKHNIEYLYNPIKKIGHINDNNYINIVDDFFQINTLFKSINSVNFDKKIFMKDHLTISDIDEHKFSDENVLFIIDHVYFIIDPMFRHVFYNNNYDLSYNDELWSQINTYEYAMNILKKGKKFIDLPEYNNDKTNIAIHIRRGDVNSQQNSDRFVPLEKYYGIIENLNNQYNNAVFYIFTEITNDKEEFDLFYKTNSEKGIQIKMMADVDLLTTIEYMIKADVLVMSKSALSYLAALYNDNTVLYIKFWHNRLPHWKEVKNPLCN